MTSYDDNPSLYEGGLVEALEDCPGQWGLCCNLGDAFLRALGRCEYKTITLHAQGIGMRKLRLVGVQGDVLRGVCPRSGNILLIPLCSICAFYENDLLPAVDELGEKAVLHLAGDSGCRGCQGIVPELERLVGQRVVVKLQDYDADMLLTEVIGLTLRAVSGEAVVTMRADCLDALELPYSPEPGV